MPPNPFAHIETVPNEPPLFACLNQEERHELEAQCRRRDFPRNARVFSQGEQAHGLYVVAAGLLKIHHISPRGRETVLHLIGPGDTAGEAAVFQRAAYPANAVAIKDTHAIYVPADPLLRLIAKNPEIALRLLAVLSMRLRVFTDKFQMQQGDSAQRLASFLLHCDGLSRQKGVIRLEASQEVLANMLGLARETFSRALSALSALGVAALKGRTLRILDHAALQSIAEGVSPLQAALRETPKDKTLSANAAARPEKHPQKPIDKRRTMS